MWRGKKERLWESFTCPKYSGAASCSFRREGRLYWQCAACRHQCSVIVGTIFESTKLPLTIWFLAMHLLTQTKNNVSALELKRHLGVSYLTAWLVKHKLMEVMRVEEESRRLTGRVEIDDAYLGGERSGGKPLAWFGEQGAHRRGSDRRQRQADARVFCASAVHQAGDGRLRSEIAMRPLTVVSDA